MNIIIPETPIEPKLTAVYKFTIDNKWVYIGCSNNVRRRMWIWKHHFIKGFDKQKYIIDYFTENSNIEFQLIQICESHEYALFLESLEIFTNIGNDFLLNRIKRPTEKEYSLMDYRVGIAQFDKNGNLVSVFKSISDAEEKVGKKIREFFNGQRLSIRGCTFKKINENGEYIDFQVRKRKSPNRKIEINRKLLTGKKILKYDMNGNFVKEYLSVRDAAADIGRSRAVIQRVLKGQRKHNLGFVYKVKE